MASPSASNASFGVRRLLRRGWLPLILGWFALWLGAIHATCAVPLLAAGSSGTVAQVSAINYTPTPQRSASCSAPLYCQQLLDASTTAQSAAVLHAPDDRAANLLPASAPHPLVVRGDGRFAANYPSSFSPSGRALYLRTLRLLI